MIRSEVVSIMGKLDLKQLFNHSFIKYLLSSYYCVLGTVLIPMGIMVSENRPDPFSHFSHCVLSSMSYKFLTFHMFKIKLFPPHPVAFLYPLSQVMIP